MSKYKNEKGKTFAYVRVSSTTQNVESQLEILKRSDFVIDEIVEEKLSGKNLERPKFQQLLKTLRSGDILLITSLDRIGRSVADLNELLKWLKSEKVRLISLRENLDFVPEEDEIKSSLTNLMFHIISAIAEYERKLILERQRIGIDRAKAEGKYTGRKRVAKPLNFDLCLEKYEKSTRYNSYRIKDFAKETGLKVSTLQGMIKKEREKKESENH